MKLINQACKTAEASTNTPKNWKEEESPNDKLHTEEQMAVPDSPPPKEDYGLQDYLGRERTMKN